MNIFEELGHKIKGSKKEQDILPFFKRNDALIRNAFATSWNFTLVIPEFCLGKDYKLDFLLLCANSGNWQAHLIEFESPISKLYNKDGTPTKALRKGQMQIQNWKQWIDLNKQCFRNSISEIPKLSHAGAQCSRAGIHDIASSELRDPKTIIHFEYHIVISRRKFLLVEDQNRRAISDGSWGSPEIVTYDRFLSIAKNLKDI